MIKIEPIENSTEYILHFNADSKTERVRCILDICQSLSCQCKTIGFQVLPDSGNTVAGIDQPLKFSVDVYTERLEGNECSKDHKFAEAFVSGLENKDWDLLKGHFIGFKRHLTENYDLSTVETEFPAELIEKDGLSIGYKEILPFAKDLIIKMGEDSLIVDEQYCLNPSCSCIHAYLTFIPVQNNQIVEDKGISGIRVDYINKTWEKEDAPKDTLLLPELRSALEEAEPDIYNVLHKHHAELRRLYRKYRIDKNSALGPSNITARIGRNGPCPCGSGKKYKKCCLQKS